MPSDLKKKKAQAKKEQARQRGQKKTAVVKEEEEAAAVPAGDVSTTDGATSLDSAPTNGVNGNSKHDRDEEFEGSDEELEVCEMFNFLLLYSFFSLYYTRLGQKWGGE